MNRRLIIGLTLSAWCLYVASLFLPALDIDSNSAIPSYKGGDLEQGWEVLRMCANPFYWIDVDPFVYLIVNVGFFFSPVSIWRLLDGRKSTFYTVLASQSAVVASLVALGVVGDVGVGVGYFAWTAAITLVAVATCIPVPGTPVARSAAPPEATAGRRNRKRFESLWSAGPNDQDSRQPKRPIKVKLVILWHWLIVVATAWGGLHAICSTAVLVGAGLFGCSIWAAKTVIAFIQDQDAALLTMQRVHRSVKYTAGLGAIGSLLLVPFFLMGQNWITDMIAIFSGGVALCCSVVFVISRWVTRTLDE